MSALREALLVSLLVVASTFGTLVLVGFVLSGGCAGG